jgi:hypothetical protein
MGTMFGNKIALSAKIGSKIFQDIAGVLFSLYLLSVRYNFNCRLDIDDLSQHVMPDNRLQ